MSTISELSSFIREHRTYITDNFYYFKNRTYKDTIKDLLDDDIQYSGYAKRITEGHLTSEEDGDILVGFIAIGEASLTCEYSNILVNHYKMKDSEFQWALYDTIFPIISLLGHSPQINNVNGEVYAFYVNLQQDIRATFSKALGLHSLSESVTICVSPNLIYHKNTLVSVSNQTSFNRNSHYAFSKLIESTTKLTTYFIA